jgi:alkanesulfonate monooxygenase SsuD/methylene tetrahydromethanopterin reductase-like flavin-dependent oxidoreductase (luciferase family)
LSKPAQPEIVGRLGRPVGGAPVEGALDLEPQPRARRRLLAVLRVLGGQRLEPARAVAELEPLDAAEQLHPGRVDASFRRAARYGLGWILGGGTPDDLAEGKQNVEQAWREAGREGEPHITALAYFALGDRGEEGARSYLGHYYAAMGEETANAIIASAATDEDTVRAYITAFTEAGCDELFLFPCSSDPEQVDLLAAAAS